MSTAMRAALAACAALMVVPSGATATRLTIYSSLPFAGEIKAQSTSVINAERLALAEAGGRVGDFEITFKSLNSATASAGKWDPGAVAKNARTAIYDKTTIAYIGEFNSAASGISLPILNANSSPILQVSPSNTAVGLTRYWAAGTGEPDKFYPSGKRSYGRVVPADHLQAQALAVYARQIGCSRVAILDDGQDYGRGLALMLAQRLGGAKLKPAGRWTLSARSRAATVAKVRAKHPSCVVYNGITQNGAVPLFRALHKALPTAKLLGSDGVAERAFTRRLGGAARFTYITEPTLAPEAYPEAGQAFFASYRAQYGNTLEPYAIYGYEAMSVVLQAIKDAGDKGSDRQAVIDAFFAIKDRESVLGTYSIDEDGDTTLVAYGGNRVDAQGRLVYDRTITW